LDDQATTTAPEAVAFLADCGDIGRRIAAFDWAATPLGPIPAWPHSLRHTVALMLRSPAPMALMWGAQGILLYNEGYAAIAGGRHPAILGMKALAAWPEAADLNAQVIATCRAGRALSFKDRHLTLHRNGAPEDVWLDIAYSPVLGDDDRPAGALAVITETTQRVLADERLRIAQAAGRFGAFEWFPHEARSVVSTTYREIYGLAADEEATDARLLAMIPEQDRDRTGNRRLGQGGNPLAYTEYRIRHPASGDIRWIARRGEMLPGGADTPPRYIGVAWDITEKKQAELQAAFLAALSDRLRDLTDARAVLDVASEMLGRHLAAGRVGYGEMDADTAHCTVERDWTDGVMPSIAGRHAMDAFGRRVADQLRRGETIRVNDALTDPRLQEPGLAEAYAIISTRARLVVPLIRDGSFVGLMFAQCTEPRVWSDADVEVIEAVAARTWDSVQRARAEQRLRDSEANFRLLAEAVPLQVWQAGPDGRVFWVNDYTCTYTGEARADLYRDDWARLIYPDDMQRTIAWYGQLIAEGIGGGIEYRMRRADGTFRWHIVRVMPIRGTAGQIIRWIGTSTDIEDQRRALADQVRVNAMLEERVEERTRALRETEAALRQSQKMEAIGQLTGGIAHDFNNLLASIIGALQLIRRRLARNFPADDTRVTELHRFMDGAIASAHRGAALIHRLLAFARRQALDTKPVDVAALLHGMDDLLRRTLGEQVQLGIDVPAECWPAMTDANQLESAILNLAINARDAMQPGGKLTIAAACVALDAVHGNLEPGDYVAISVADTGAGMPAEVIEKAFDPFFTTKPAGQGTGLGLSMVYGFMRQSGGHVDINSVVGQGTTITLYLPRAAAPAAAAAVATIGAAPLGSGQTVLVVEDVPAVRMLIVEVLRDLGYAPIETADADTALPVIDGDGAIDLLVSDVGLPGLNGCQIADHARAKRPGLKVLFVTGYAEDEAIRGGTLAPGTAVITKPFEIDALAAKISDMMKV
jgi:PAS domain S-box-containing protein